MKPLLRYGLLLGKLLLSVGILAWLLGQTGAGPALLENLRIKPSAVLGALGVILLSILFGTWRWMSILRRLEEPVALCTALRIVFIGLFFNQVLPSQLGGDVVRLWRLHRVEIPLQSAVHSLLLDRLVAFFSLALLVAAALPGILRLGLQPEFTMGLSVLLLFVFGGVALLTVADHLPLPDRWHGVQLLHTLARDTRTVLFRGRWALLVLGHSLAAHLCFVLTAWLLARGMGIELGFLHSLLLMPAVILVSVIPVSLAGWGVREGAMVLALAPLGVPPEAAFTLSIVFGLVVLVSSLPGVLLWLGAEQPRGRAVETEVSKQ